MTIPFHKQEEARQAQILTDAIHTAIIETGRTFEAPMLNAVGGALASNLVQVLASIGDRRTRKIFRAEIDRAISKGLANAPSDASMHVETVIVGGDRH